MPAKIYSFDGDHTWLGAHNPDISVTIDSGAAPAYGTFIASETTVGLHGTVNGIPSNTPMTVNNAAIPAIVGSSDPANPLVIERVQFKGVPNCQSGYILFRHCDFYFLPQPSTIQRPCVLVTNLNAHVTIQDSDIHADYSDPDNQPNELTVGITCTNALIERCRVWDTSDGFNPTKGNVTIRGCWIGKQLYISPAPLRQASNTDPPYYENHADCIQIADGSNYIIEYNTLEGYNDLTLGQAAVFDNNATGSCRGYYPGGYSMANSGIQFNLKAGMRNITVANNHFRGGRAGINGAGTLDGFTLTLADNTYDRTVYNNNQLILPAAFGTDVSFTNQVFEDDGSTVNPKRY